MTDKGLPHIVDSCVLIDYTSVNPQILRLAVQHIGPVIVTVQVLDEVEAFDETWAVKAGITAYWGFEMMLVLCANGHLDRDTALSTARGICLVNRYIADKVLADFEAKIEDIFDS